MRIGLPEDPAQWVAVAMSVAAAVAAPRIAEPARRKALFLGAAALAASLLSTLYIAAYLRGGPRIVDATSYWLEARAISEGLFRWPIDEPVAATLGRFLVRSDTPEGPGAAVIFPPGYPALLAIGFLVGAPLAIGPLLAAALVVVTYDLGEQIAASRCSAGSASDPNRAADSDPSIPQIAAALSVVCGALRYHTADTMSHGLSALCFAGSLALSMRAMEAARSSLRRALALASGAGLLAGWLVATRPVSSIALALTLLALLALPSPSPLAPPAHPRAAPLRERAWIAATIALSALPGLALLAAHQRAATGAFAASSQALYYAVSDGPPGCFRYGFGPDIGCIGEHGDFIAKYMSHGYGALEAIKTTARRLLMHLVDAANAEPLALLVPAGALLGWRSPRVRLFAAAIALLIAAYVPFYFDGNYPGGGARFFADVLPLEHVLAAVAAAAIAERTRGPLPRARRLAGSVVALSIAAFAVRASFDHAALRDREGASPMFDPARLAAAGVTRGLVFLDTDHGFSIAYDPASPTPASALSFARYHGDAIDLMAWEARGRPDAYRYHFVIPEGGGAATVTVSPVRFDLAAALHIEGESLWPALAQEGGAFALPAYASDTCASGSRLLAVHARPAKDHEVTEAGAAVVLSLPSPWLRGRSITPAVATTLGASGEIQLLLDGVAARTWPVNMSPASRSDGAALTCQALPAEPIPEGARRIDLRITRSPSSPGLPAGLFALDRLDLGERKND